MMNIFRMCLQMAEIDDETDDDLGILKFEHDELDDVELRVRFAAS